MQKFCKHLITSKLRNTNISWGEMVERMTMLDLQHHPIYPPPRYKKKKKKVTECNKNIEAAKIIPQYNSTKISWLSHIQARTLLRLNILEASYQQYEPTFYFFPRAGRPGSLMLFKQLPPVWHELACQFLLKSSYSLRTSQYQDVYKKLQHLKHNRFKRKKNYIR